MSVYEIEKPNLAPDVEAELADERFATRKHGSRATHSAGCHGPLCRRAEALRGRRRSQERAERSFREYQPSLRRKRDDDRNEELAIAAAWHWADLARRRAEVDALRSLRAPEVAVASDDDEAVLAS
jgi:hypothetical protein